ncbi:MAG: cell division protein ZapA [Novosphingobium sp.]
MSNLDLPIGGRNFTVACASGEEAHIAALGKIIDAKVTSMNGAAGQGEARMLLFAALLLADELHELKHGKGPAPAPEPPAPPPEIDPAVAEKLEAIAISLENCALHLESGGQDA